MCFLRCPVAYFRLKSEFIGEKLDKNMTEMQDYLFACIWMSCLEREMISSVSS